jgi:hypothetical protein
MTPRRLLHATVLVVFALGLGGCAKGAQPSIVASPVVESGKTYRFSWGLLGLRGTVVSADGCWATVNGIPTQSQGMAGAPKWAESGQVKVNLCTVSLVQETQSGG